MKLANNKSTSIRVVTENISANPSCSHGPTLLFVRKNERFFACSAYRSRKYCNFYCLESKSKSKKEYNNILSKITPIDRHDLFNKFTKMKFSQDCHRSYCHHCSVLFNPSEENNHQNHEVQNSLSFDILTCPSKLLKPLENNKKEAQYLFSNDTIETIVNILIQNNFKNIICIGTPRIHEYIRGNCQDRHMTSILMDIDQRHRNFNAIHEFFHYNMFNHHFFDGEDIKSEYFLDFLKNCHKKNVCVLIDPPFGGRIEPLANTLQELTKELNSHSKSIENELVSTMLFMPYFMESHIKNHIFGLKMSDYQISYENHQNFQNNEKNKNGSPVRFFTNISLNTIKLPESEGYKYCKICEIWIGPWNRHCNKCNRCTSKNGSTYVHCDKCRFCVKSSWNHCISCEQCHLKDSDCGNLKYDQDCFHCGIFGHKKSQCPQTIVKKNRE